MCFLRNISPKTCPTAYTALSRWLVIVFTFSLTPLSSKSRLCGHLLQKENSSPGPVSQGESWAKDRKGRP